MSPAPQHSVPVDAAIPRRRNVWLEIAAILGFWTFLAVLTAGSRILDPFSENPMSAAALRNVLPVFLNYYMWAVLTPLIFWMSSRFTVDRENWILLAPLHLTVAFVVAIGVDIYDDVLRINFSARPGWQTAIDPFQAISRFWWLNELIIYLAVLSAGFARDFFIRYQARQAEAVQLRLHADRLQAQLSEARLQALRMQVNPHFLFNTLHAVSSLVERDPQGVRRMLARLSELLRYTLEDGSESEVPLRQELDFLDRYLEIQKIRFQGRLEVEKDVDPEVLDALVPNLILQPIVENAVKHGASKATGVGRVSIRARRDADRLVVSVGDNGPGLETDTLSEEQRGFGLRNTRDRLEELYGASFELAFRSPPDGGLVADVALPYHTSPALHTATVVGDGEE